MLDTDTCELVQVGGEAEIVAEDVDLIASMVNIAREQQDEVE